MSKPATKVRTEDELRHDLKVKDQETRRTKFIELVTAAEIECQIKLDVQIDWTPRGAYGRPVMIDTKGQEQTTEIDSVQDDTKTNPA